MTFDLYSFRFHFVALEQIHFPPGRIGNILRGAFGIAFRSMACSPQCPGFHGRDVRECDRRASCSYAKVFEPVAIGDGPSGFADRPRPFVFRGSHLDGKTIERGESFWFGVNLFDVRNPLIDDFRRALAELAREGLGPTRGRADLASVEQMDRDGCAVPGAQISIPLEGVHRNAQRVRVEFRTPTELKGGQGLVTCPEFAVLFARARDRVSTLRALYGEGPLEIDFHGMGERAAGVRMTRSDLRQVESTRRSSRTGQVHGIGGFVGVAEYQGALDEFVPYLEATRWTGVGRHCVWGNGEMIVHCILE